jgi:hypothetical protein
MVGRGLNTIRESIEDARQNPPAAAIARLFDRLGLLALSEQSSFDALPTRDTAFRTEAFAASADVFFGVAAVGGILVIVGLLTGTVVPRPASAVSR